MLKQSAVCLIGLLLLSACAFADSVDMRPYPEAESGYQRLAIVLPQKADEHLFKLELLPGKQMEIDCNQHRFAGKLSLETVSGWGYNYYLVSEIGGPMSTMMACPPDEAKRNAFVPVDTENRLIRYNSKLPVVVYLPEGFALRYRIWSAGAKLEEALAR